uniref:Putative secreted protein n=1 Tax=Anopheles darlingi TaxID=43151 RepID=A0A2M4DDM2_ANODA
MIRPFLLANVPIWSVSWSVSSWDPNGGRQRAVHYHHYHPTYHLPHRPVDGARLPRRLRALSERTCCWCTSGPCFRNCDPTASCTIRRSYPTSTIDRGTR